MDQKILDILGKITESGGRVKRMNVLPLLRISVSLLAIILCALSQNFAFVGIIIAVELVRFAMLPAQSVRSLFPRLILPVLFTLLIMVPSFFLGHPKTVLTVTLKVFESVIVLIILNEDLEWRDITGALQAIRIPDIFTMTLDMTVRFIIILSRYAAELLEAVKLRSVGTARGSKSDKRRMTSAGGVLGTVFLKSGKASEETYEAMECRGYSGKYISYKKHKMNITDIVYIVLIPILLILFIYLKNA